MNPQTLQVIQSTFDASKQGQIHFGQVIAQLISVGVESYHVDYRSGRTTYYLPDGTTLDLFFNRPTQNIPQAFNTQAVRAAIVAAQQGLVMYPEFVPLTQQAGCIGYTVWIQGRHVNYLGHCGEMHTEHFPD